MSKAKKAVNPNTQRDYQHEVRVEPSDNAGEQSNALAESKGEGENTVNTSNLLENVLHRDNLNHAYKRVLQNGGSQGVDGMKTDALLDFLQREGENIKQMLLVGTYHPQPVRRVEIPKPD
jgi:RNA-directed DNA polymerase